MATLTDSAPIESLFLMALLVVLSIAYFIAKLAYVHINDPLKHIPGPKLNALSRIPYVRHLLKGTTVENVVELHKKYGSVVRLTPNEVSFTSGETAWRDIYGFRTGKLKGHLNMQKDPLWYAPPANGVPSLLMDDDENHSKNRRLLSHAFSDKALQEQEPLIQIYVDQLIDRLKEVTSGEGQPINMAEWYNWITFDIVADLLFGEPFGCLQNLSTHKHIDLLFKALKGFRFLYIVGYYPIVKYLGSLIVDQKMLAGRKQYMAWVSDQVSKRLSRETDRPDFMTYISAHNGERGLTMSKGQLDSNANLILTAGSETTATLLSGATYLLLKNPSKLSKLTHEIRTTWRTYNEITLFEANSSAPYLIATLNEALRYFPPVPTGFERKVQRGGEIISGVYIPEGTAVQVSQWPTHHSSENFADSEDFVPERWLDDRDRKYENDKRAAMQPFSFGPRNCLGKNLALAEMRLIMAKLLWTFDMTLDPRSEEWIKGCKVFTLWDKPKLLVKLTFVDRS